MSVALIQLTNVNGVYPLPYLHYNGKFRLKLKTAPAIEPVTRHVFLLSGKTVLSCCSFSLSGSQTTYDFVLWDGDILSYIYGTTLRGLLGRRVTRLTEMLINRICFGKSST